MENKKAIKLLKQIKPKNSLPELNEYLIKDNTVTIHNVMNIITIRLDDTIPDGLYSIMNDQFIKSNFSLNNYQIPFYTNEFDFIDCKILVNDLLKVHSGVSYESRFNLYGILLSGENNQMVSTDGCKLIMKDMEFIINPDSINHQEQIKEHDFNFMVNLSFHLPILKKYKNETINKFFFNKAHFFFELDDICFYGTIEHQRFPNYKTVIPEKFNYSIDCSSLVNSNFDKIKIAGRNNGINLFSDKDRNDLLSIAWKDDKKDKFFIIETDIKTPGEVDLNINKNHLVECLSHNHILHYNDNDSALGNKDYIFMPLSA